MTVKKALLKHFDAENYTATIEIRGAGELIWKECR